MIISQAMGRLQEIQAEIRDGVHGSPSINQGGNLETVIGQTDFGSGATNTGNPECSAQGQKILDYWRNCRQRGPNFAPIALDEKGDLQPTAFAPDGSMLMPSREGLVAHIKSVARQIVLQQKYTPDPLKGALNVANYLAERAWGGKDNGVAPDMIDRDKLREAVQTQRQAEEEWYPLTDEERGEEERFRALGYCTPRLRGYLKTINTR